MRLIDVDALTKRLVEFCNKSCPYTAKARNVMCGSCFMGLALEAVEDAPTIEPDPKWIPCSERLPIGSDVVLISLPPSIDANGDELAERVICGHYIGGKNELWGISDGSTIGYGLVSTRYGTNPTHWMPLPEAYKEDKREAD